MVDITVAAYHNLGPLKSATVPIEPTGAGAIYPYEDRTTQQLVDKSLFFWARATARAFFVRSITTFLSATGMLAFLAFLTTINGTDRSKMYITALSVIINSVAVMHYKWIGKIRGYNGPPWLHDKYKGQDLKENAWLPFNKWNEKTAIGVEIMVEGLRHSDWLVCALRTQPHGHARLLMTLARCAQITMIFLTFKIYALINRPFTDYNHIFASVEAAAATAAVMILLGAYARIGTDEFWEWKNVGLFVSGLVAYIASGTCLVLLLLDMGRATECVTDGYFFRSFFYVWIGYPCVAAIGIIWRLTTKCMYPAYSGGYAEWLSLFKDLAFGLLDVWSKGVFAMWTAYTVFDVTLFDSAAATPTALACTR